MIHADRVYLDALKTVLENGGDRPDRTGTGTRSVFGLQMRFNLQDGFPAITTKKLAWKAVVSELLWFIEGSGDEFRLREILHGERYTDKKTIWTDNAQATFWTAKRHQRHPGDLGRVYGVQWRRWRKPLIRINKVVLQNHDQLLELIDGIKADPYSRRHIITAWNPGELDLMALPPCHMMAQFYVQPYTQDEINNKYLEYRRNQQKEIKAQMDVGREGRAKTIDDLKKFGLPTEKLSCQMYQRSADMFLGVPFNIASYALFTHMIAQVCNLDVGDLIVTIGDAHIYQNHFDQVLEQMSREPLPLPVLQLNSQITDITKFTMGDISLGGYQSHDAIKAPMSV